MTLVVAWLAGLAGVGFVVVAVYGLLQRLGRGAEQRLGRLATRSGLC